jgi:hypothetical protein
MTVRGARAMVDRLVPVPVRRILAFDLKGMVSLVRWAARRRDGVPPGAVAVSYWREFRTVWMMFLFAVVVETVATDALLRAVHAPAGLRLFLLTVDVYGVLIVLAIGASAATRPHVVSADELRVRWGAFFDLRVPRDTISSVRLARNFNERGMVAVDGERLAVATASQTNVIVELTCPATAVRPLGRRVRVRTIRFFADRPDAAVVALRSRPSATSGISEPGGRGGAWGRPGAGPNGRASKAVSRRS